MAYGQKDPAVEYKIQGFEMFGYMIENIKIDTVKTLYHIQVEQNVEREEVAEVTGTNKDDSDGVKKPKQRVELRFIQMIHVLVEVERNIRTVVDVKHKFI